jgi:hypothetical protein
VTWTRGAADPHRAGFRWHVEFSRTVWAIALWVPWRHPSRPLIYAFKSWF